MDILIDRNQTASHIWTLLTYALDECCKKYSICIQEITAIVIPAELEEIIFETACAAEGVRPHVFTEETRLDQLGFIYCRLWLKGVAIIPSSFIGKNQNPDQYWISFI